MPGLAQNVTCSSLPCPSHQGMQAGAAQGGQHVLRGRLERDVHGGWAASHMSAHCYAAAALLQPLTTRADHAALCCRYHCASLLHRSAVPSVHPTHPFAQVEAEAYWVSKVQAERAAWEMAGQLGVDLVTILPGGLKTMRLRCRRCPQQPAGCAGWQLSTTRRQLPTAATGPRVAAAATVPRRVHHGTADQRTDRWHQHGLHEGGQPQGCMPCGAHGAAWAPSDCNLLRYSQHVVAPANCCPSLPIAAPCLTYKQAWVEGKAQSGAPVFADVRDVARAHILAAENPAASGRYIVANSHTTPAAHISAWLQASAVGRGCSYEGVVAALGSSGGGWDAAARGSADAF